MKSNKEVLEMIATNMKNDAKNFDGQHFNGKTVATYFGDQGAAISALANIMKSILEQITEIKEHKHTHHGFCLQEYEEESCHDCPKFEGCLELRDKEIKEKSARAKN